MPLIWDEDAAEAAILAWKKDVRGAFTYQRTGRSPFARSLRRRVWKVTTLAGVRRTTADARLAGKFDPAWQRSSNVELKMNTARAREVLGWTPKYPNAIDVMKRFVEVFHRPTNRKLRTFFRVSRWVESNGRR